MFEVPLVLLNIGLILSFVDNKANAPIGTVVGPVF